MLLQFFLDLGFDSLALMQSDQVEISLQLVDCFTQPPWLVDAIAFQQGQVMLEIRNRQTASAGELNPEKPTYP